MIIKVRTNNPFITGYLNEFSDNTPLLLRKQLEYVPSPKDQFYVIQMGLDLTDIAYRFYGDSKYWFVLVDINNIINPFELVVGDTLIIPDLDRIKATAI